METNKFPINIKGKNYAVESAMNGSAAVFVVGEAGTTVHIEGRPALSVLATLELSPGMVVIVARIASEETAVENAVKIEVAGHELAIEHAPEGTLAIYRFAERVFDGCIFEVVGATERVSARELTARLQPGFVMVIARTEEWFNVKPNSGYWTGGVYERNGIFGRDTGGEKPKLAFDAIYVDEQGTAFCGMLRWIENRYMVERITPHTVAPPYWTQFVVKYNSEMELAAA